MRGSEYSEHQIQKELAFDLNFHRSSGNYVRAYGTLEIDTTG
jgi:hypothetical protein